MRKIQIMLGLLSLVLVFAIAPRTFAATKIQLSGNIVSDWSYASYLSNVDRAIPVLNAFYNVEATTTSRIPVSKTGVIPAQSIFWGDIASGKFTEVGSDQTIDPWNDPKGRVVPIVRQGTTAVWIIYTRVTSPSTGRALSTDRLIRPAQDICGWGQGGC